MKKKKNEEGGSKIEIAARKVAGDATVDAIMQMESGELAERLRTLAEHERETEISLEENEALLPLREKAKEAKDILKEAEGPFKDALKSITAQRRLVAEVLEGRGKAVKK